MQKFSQSYYVTGHDMDLSYRMVPMSALAYFEDCFARYAASKFLAAFDIVDRGLYWIISEIDIRFEGDLPFWSESFQVDLWISEKSRIKIFCDFTMSYRGKVFARGNSCWVVMDKNRHRPYSTALLDGKMDVIEELAVGPHEKFGWNDSGNVLHTLTHQVNMGDIDFNRHVNNRTYLNLAVACHSETFGLDNTIKSIKVRFMQECFMGDTLVCTEYGLGDNVCSYKLEKGDATVCNIILEWEALGEKQTAIEEYPLAVRE